MSDLITALNENRCYICGTEGGKIIKVLDNIYTISITADNLVPVCNLCRASYPPHAANLDLQHIVWTVLEKRLQQHDVYNKVCKCGCGSAFTTSRKEREFYSDNCRAKYWQKNAKRKEEKKDESIR